MTTPNVKPPLQEDFSVNISIEKCIADPKGLICLPPKYDGMEVREQDLLAKYINAVPIDVVRATEPDKAYLIIPEIEPIDLSHHGPNWGSVYFCVVIPRRNTYFQMPDPNVAKRVAIKRLTISIVNEYLKRGGNENPYKEIQRMQMYGDNMHMLSCIEALYDEKFLYIVMPYCDGGNLVQYIFSEKLLSLNETFGSSAAIYLSIIENIKYLHQNQICHRDLSPDNVMILNGRIVFTDLAMSLRYSISADGYGLIANTSGGFYGKAAYCAPEIISGFHYFEATMCDLWSSAVILFNLLTGLIAWEVGLPSDIRFRYLVLAGGLSRMSVNERSAEMLLANDDQNLLSLSDQCLDLNPNVADLLEGVLRLDPNKRWKINQVENCIWLEAHRQLR